MNKIDKIINYFRKLKEDVAVASTPVPTNSLSGGHIAGTIQAGDYPPVKNRRKFKNYATGGIGSRKLWIDHLKKQTSR